MHLNIFLRLIQSLTSFYFFFLSFQDLFTRFFLLLPRDLGFCWKQSNICQIGMQQPLEDPFLHLHSKQIELLTYVIAIWCQLRLTIKYLNVLFLWTKIIILMQFIFDGYDFFVLKSLFWSPKKTKTCIRLRCKWVNFFQWIVTTQRWQEYFFYLPTHNHTRTHRLSRTHTHE